MARKTQEEKGSTVSQNPKSSGKKKAKSWEEKRTERVKEWIWDTMDVIGGTGTDDEMVFIRDYRRLEVYFKTDNTIKKGIFKYNSPFFAYKTQRMNHPIKLSASKGTELINIIEEQYDDEVMKALSAFKISSNEDYCNKIELVRAEILAKLYKKKIIKKITSAGGNCSGDKAEYIIKNGFLRIYFRTPENMISEIFKSNDNAHFAYETNILGRICAVPISIGGSGRYLLQIVNDFIKEEDKRPLTMWERWSEEEQHGGPFVFVNK